MSSLRNNYPAISGGSNLPMSRNTTDDGTVTGSPDMNLDFSLSETDFYFQPDPNTDFHINELTLEISDAGNSAFEDYGSIVGPLTNGIGFFVLQNGVERQLSVDFKSNADLLRVVGDLQFLEFSANVRIATYTDIEQVLAASPGEFNIILQTGALPVGLLERSLQSTSPNVIVGNYEDVVFTGGTPVTITNTNRIIDSSSLASVLINPTISDNGTLLVPSKTRGTAGSGNRDGLSAGSGNSVLVLKPNTNYLFKLTNDDGSAAELDYSIRFADLEGDIT